MSLSRLNFETISESDLLEQISAGVPEGVLVDYKRSMYGGSDSDTKEFLKDISSFANTSGGHLVIGLDETAGIPTSAFGLSNLVEPGKARDVQELLKPMDSMGYSPRVNFDGFSNGHQGADGKCWSYTQVFRSGAIEAVKVRVVSDLQPGQLWIPTLDFDRWIFEALPDYLSALQRLDVPPPVILMITLRGVRGARLGVAPESFAEVPKIDRDVLELPECIIEQYGAAVDYQRAARPAFDALWNTGGFARSPHFDATGKWTPLGR